MLSFKKRKRTLVIDAVFRLVFIFNIFCCIVENYIKISTHTDTHTDTHTHNDENDDDV